MDNCLNFILNATSNDATVLIPSHGSMRDCVLLFRNNQTIVKQKDKKVVFSVWKTKKHQKKFFRHT